MIAEAQNRRPDFREGREIALADGRWWTFPAPSESSHFLAGESHDRYLGLLQTIIEAEDDREQTLGELALALFLFRLNYALTPAQVRSLFTFEPGSAELAESKMAFAQLAMQHLEFSPFARTASASPATTTHGAETRHPFLKGLLAFFRVIRPSKPLSDKPGRKVFPNSDGQAIEVSV